MVQEANGSNLLIGRGKVFFDRFDATGLPTGVRFLGEVNKADITAAATSVERYTMTKATKTKIANVVTQQKHTIAIELMEVTRKNAALALMGDDAIVTQAQTTVTNEVIAGAAGQAKPGIGVGVQTSKKNISLITLVAVAVDGSTTTPLVQDVDWELEDASIGLITLLSATAAAANTVKATTYTAGVIAGSKVTAGTSPNIRGKLLFVGDPASGQKMNVQVWIVELTPSGAFALLSDDFASFTLDAEVIADPVNHPTAPLYEVYFPLNQ